MKIDLQTEWEYIPHWKDNRKKKKEDQVVVVFRQLSGKDLTEIMDDDGKIDKYKDWMASCKEVRNLEVNKISITPEGLFNQPGLLDLFIECKTALRDGLKLDKKK